MATVIELVARGELSKLDPQLDVDQQELRIIYASPRLRRWVATTLPTLGSSWNIEEQPVEQLVALVEVYAAGETLTYGWTFKPLVHLGDGVWALKTADLRMFGWFTARDCFIGHIGDTKDRTQLHGLYRGYADDVVRYRNGLDLDEPKFVPGDDPHDVISDFDYP